MGPVFPCSLIMVSGSGEADGGKQLLSGSQGHLPKAWEGNVATGKVKKVWAAKPEHPHLALNLWHCLATSSLVERSRGEKGRHWQGWHDAFPQVPQRTAKCKASLSARPLRFQRYFYIFPLHLAIGHALLSPGISTVSTPAGTGGREGAAIAQQPCHPQNKHLWDMAETSRAAFGSHWHFWGCPILTFLACSSVLLEKRRWDGRREAGRWAWGTRRGTVIAPCSHGALHRRATPIPEPPEAGSSHGSSSAGADVMCVSHSRAKQGEQEDTGQAVPKDLF